jgi:preprotein translocase subunit YajC
MENNDLTPEKEIFTEDATVQPEPEITAETVESASAEAFSEVEPEPIPADNVPPVVTEVDTKPSSLERFWHWLFDKESRRGRFVRSALRWTALVLGAFALGLVAFYFIQFRPLQARLADTQAQLDESRAEVTQISGKLADADKENKDLTAVNMNLEEDLRVATARIYIAQIQSKGLNARLQLNIRQGAAAQKSLKEAKDLLADLNEVMGEDSQQVLDQLETRLAAATTALLTDPTVAIQDLETFDALLAQQEKILTK